MDATLKSALYECEVVHQRLRPRRHGFRYSIFFLDVWLDELPQLDRQLRLFSFDRPNIYSFRNEDHLDLGVGHLRLNLERWLLETQGVSLDPQSRIRLITLPRILGYFFNPVCFYFIYSPTGVPIHAICEVTNTFHEMKPYWLPAPSSSGHFELLAPKHFYVSPFSSLKTSFHFRLEVPEDRIRIHIDDVEEGERSLVSWIHGQRRPLTDSRLAWYLLRYPLLTFQVIFKIHWQALLLWLRKFKVYRKGADPHLQRDLFRPHHSISHHHSS